MKVVQFTIPVAADHSVILQEDRLPYFYEHLHRHKETQIMYIVSGEGTVIAGNCMQRFTEGDIYIIGADQPHVFKSNPEYFNKRSKKQVHSLIVFFNPEGSFAPVLALPEMKLIKKFLSITGKGLQAYPQHQGLLANALLELKGKNHSQKLSAFIDLLQLMASLKKWKTLSTEDKDYGISDSEGLRMNDIYQYTMSNFMESISLQEIASVAHMTAPAFCRYFKKHTRKTYLSFLNEVRISEACKKMISGKYESLSAIAYQTGFTNTVTFNRVFKKITGMPPGMYIREYQQ